MLFRSGIINHRQAIFKAEKVGYSSDGEGGAPEIIELPRAVQRGRIEHDVRVNVFLVCMGADDKSVFAFRQRHRQVIADLVRQLRCDLSRLEGLPQVVSNHVMLLLVAPRHRGILPL